MPWKYIIEDLHGEKIDGAFYEKELQKNEIEFRTKKVKRTKMVYRMLRGKVMMIHLIAG